MKKIIKIVLAVLFVGIITACKPNARVVVENYLNEYQNLSEDVISNMNDIVARENFEGEDRDTYISIFKKQYQDLKYEILSEEYDGDEATIKVKVNVYDLYKVQDEANKYLANHLKEFYNEDEEYDVNKFMKYKLDKMINTSDRVDYIIDFYVVNTSDGWTVSSLSNADLEKIHGIYNYES